MLEVRTFSTFKEMLAAIGVESFLPSFRGDLAAATALYHTLGNRRGAYGALEAEHGAVAIKVQPLSP